MILAAVTHPTIDVTVRATVAIPSPLPTILVNVAHLPTVQTADSIWTIGVAVGTCALAVATFLAVYLPRRDERARRREETLAAARLLRKIVAAFQSRVNELANDPKWCAEKLLVGLDIPFAQATSFEVQRCMPKGPLGTKVYVALVEAHNSLVLGAGMQHAGGYANALKAQTLAQESVEKLDAAGNDLFCFIAALEKGQSAR